MAKKINMAAIRLKVFIDSFLYQERGAVDIVAIVILIAVAVILGVAFKTQITKIVNDLMTKVSQEADSVFTP